ERSLFVSTKPNVLIGTPCYGGLVTTAYLHSLIKLMSYAGAHNIGLGLWTTSNDALITRNRNSIVARFLDTPGATHLMFVDADIGFEPELFHRLLRFDGDVVAGMYPLKTVDWSKVHKSARENPSFESLKQAGLHYVGVPCPPDEREERDGFVT